MHPVLFIHQKTCFHLHWHSVVKLLHGLVVDGYGHLSVSVKGELYVVARPVLSCCLVTGKLQVLAAPVRQVEAGGAGRRDKDEGRSQVQVHRSQKSRLHLLVMSHGGCVRIKYERNQV